MSQYDDKHWMARALALARRGLGGTWPNPMVGCVIVDRRGRIAGEGWHRRAGGPHAEALALRQAGSRAQGGTMYVTLEPCAHTGRTPPCVEAVLRAGVREVVVAMADPHPLTNGKSLRRLRAAGVRVRTGLLAPEARRVNAAFIKAMTQRLPLVTAKVAQTLDGKIATVHGGSRWITGASARLAVHRLRRTADAILVGITTVLKDDPRLTVRLPSERGRIRQPLRVVVDSRLRIPLRARVLRHPQVAPVLVATTARAPRSKRRQLAQRGIEALVVPARQGRVDLRRLLRALARREIRHALIEGGGEVLASAFAQRLVDRVAFFIAPKILGGRTAPTAVDGTGIADLSQALRIRDFQVQRYGEDLLVTGEVAYVHRHR
ncbi:MAG: bifunctional diaminohydroxyphosphoribosylaminopyrimidine deaminase/5-amino-6-(5-phosphoribosylamino)uracil reductase RibD [Candidatus Omnitrophica bacterium]|nr:bifunctional diaminohydroxyphosphoribosylaminopyrimidine deaminase/5-amino-6-(5-phosphoribosylamino)uracil reductase RibD [Candidatus Omnitrophota bacterium]